MRMLRYSTQGNRASHWIMKRNTHQHPEKNTEHSPDRLPDATPGLAAILLAVVIVGGILVAGAYLLNFFPSGPGPVAESGNVTVYYFYGTECPHCHNVTPYIESLRDKYPDVSFRFLEIWHDETNNSFHRLLNHKLGLEAAGVPQVIVGNISLLGDDKIQSGLEKAILAQKGNLTGSSQIGAVPAWGSSAGTDATIHATYFFGNGCSHCEAVKPLVADLQSRYPELRIDMLEINDNKTNLDTFLAMPLPEGSGTERSIPAIFIGGNALIGETEVKDHFEEKILAEKERIASGTPATPSTSGVPAAGNESIPAVYFYSDSCSHCEKVKPVYRRQLHDYPRFFRQTYLRLRELDESILRQRRDSELWDVLLRQFAATCRVVRGLRGARFGMLGARPAAFITVRFSEKLLERAGQAIHAGGGAIVDIGKSRADQVRSVCTDIAALMIGMNQEIQAR